MKRAIFWDFDGTLAFLPGMWSGCLLDVLNAHEPGHVVRRDQLSPYLRDGFPWHRYEAAHPELGEPETWWRQVEAILATAYQGVGYEPHRAAELAHLAHQRYVDVSRWHLFADTRPVLEHLTVAGWRHIILSNHVPELPLMIQNLGLGKLISTVITSAQTGYEKPHPRAFEVALAAAGDTEQVWMIGDSVDADVRGAELAGIPAILVRTSAGNVTRRAADLWGIIPILEGDGTEHPVF